MFLCKILVKKDFPFVFLRPLQWSVGFSVGLYTLHFHAEGGAFAYFRFFDIDAAFVILFDDALYQRESQTPAPPLGGVARVEDGFEAIAGNAFAVSLISM